MPRLYLTDLAIRRLKPTGKQVIYWDTASPVALRMSQAGGRSFIVVLGEKRRKVSLGKYPEQISLAEARNRGARLTQEAAFGAANVASMTFEEALEGYFRWSEQHHRTSTSYQKRGLFRRHFEERFGRKQLTAISLREVTNVLDGLSRTPSEARHAYIAIRAFLSWCCARQYLARSPCETLLPPARVGIRERVLDDAELAWVYKCASELGQFGRIVRLCILTAQRRGEIGALKWSYIDPGQRFILFPGSAVKNGKAHSLPLTEMARNLLPLQECSPYVFPGRDDAGRPYNGWSKDVERLRRAVGFRNWCLHDLRRSAASGMARIGCAPHVIERILNHSPQGMMAVYQRHQYLDEMRSALERWSTHIQGITTLDLSRHGQSAFVRGTEQVGGATGETTRNAGKIQRSPT